MEGVRGVDLKAAGLVNPLGISCREVELTWQLKGLMGEQRGAAIQISLDPEFDEGGICFDEARETREQRFWVEGPFQEKTRYYWRVKIQGEEGWGPFCEPAWFETGLSGKESWKASWIEAGDSFYEAQEASCRRFWDKEKMEDQGLRRPPYLKKTFTLKDRVKRARVYITARGFYELRLNGKKVGSCALAPDFTAYDKCIYYQTFDAAEYLSQGDNQLQVILGDGWYVGHAQGCPGTNHLYGDRPALILQMEIEDESNGKHLIVSDDSFSACTGPLLYADMMMGEYLDKRETKVCYSCVPRDYSKSVLAPQRGETIQVTQILPAVEVKRTGRDSWLVDFGQNIAGRERLRLSGNPGEEITIEHGEMLDPANENELACLIPTFPYHAQTDHVIPDSKDSFVYEPQFSFQGFRYLKITGVLELDREDCQACVIGTGMESAGSFHSSNPLLNRLTENTRWSQRGNMISIPTDCPQRERGGFTGDAQIFCSTAVWHQNVSAFFERWLEQCRLEQLEGGQIPIVVPYTKAYRESEPNPGWTSAGWGDAILFIPWDLYQTYGDGRVLEENYEAMERWMAYVKRCAAETMPEKYYMDFKNRLRQKYLWNTGHHWGDWLMPGVDSYEGVMRTKEITASLFYYRQSALMEKICRVLKKDERAEEYRKLSENIRQAFHQEYISGGRLKDEYQGLYVMALAFGMAEGEEKRLFAARLDEMVQEAKYHLGTGFLSTPFLLDVLWDCGYKDTAVRLLYQDTPPSWLYEVKKGATTIWEEWEGVDADGKLCGTSFNHYAFGCVCDFIYRRIGGIKRLAPGFEKVRIEPELVEGVDEVFQELKTVRGTVKLRWKKEAEGIRIQVEIPANMRAVIKEQGKEKEVCQGTYRYLQ